MEETNRFDWRRVPDEVAARTKELWSASLGLAQAVEEKGEELYDVLTGDRAALVERLQAEGTKAIDELQSQANRVFDDLVSRGEKLQHDSRRAVEKATRRIAERPREVVDEVSKTAEKAAHTVLKRMDIPSRKELSHLAERVERLTAEVHRLASRLAGEDPGAEPVIFEVAAADGSWMVREAGSGAIRLTTATKAEAVREGREIARASMPSELRILKLDGSVQDTAHYTDVPDGNA